MSKELKAPDKVTQKMTRDGAVAENLTTGETSSISERPQDSSKTRSFLILVCLGIAARAASKQSAALSDFLIAF